MPLRSLIGDLTTLEPTTPTLLIHVCNDVGAFGAGFAAAVALRWPDVRARYLAWAARDGGLRLGTVQPVRVSPTLTVVNLIAQHGLPTRHGGSPLDYDALATCLRTVAGLATHLQAEVVAPKLGAGLARGDWARISALLERHLIAPGIAVTIYTPPPRA